jgi:hypothetical protein
MIPSISSKPGAKGIKTFDAIVPTFFLVGQLVQVEIISLIFPLALVSKEVEESIV